MFEIVYAKSIVKDLRKIAPQQLLSLKEGIEELEMFPNISQIKRLKSHSLADYRLRIGNYRVLFDVDWEQQKIHILKIGHRRNIY
ncbi:MAG: type II toxin-antitoxin system RelE/ParE family toxin [Deltaproteobacteria bacterium]|nr:type II toxin-antitoxin system RelE/ParE family toxin [Candidatus Tharpellaceae bacterium]